MDKKIVIIGGGPGGYSAALHAASDGADVTLIENMKLGGTCLHYGCIPSKILKSTADIINKNKDGKQFGLMGLKDVALDLKTLIHRKEKILQIQEKAIEQLLHKAGVKKIQGLASFKNNNQIIVTSPDNQEKIIDFFKLIIATGSEPRKLTSIPFDHSVILSSNDMFNLTEIPHSIVIIGGGIIGCEFAFIMSSFGAKVTVIETKDRLLPVDEIDQDISKLLHRQMKKSGISVLLNSTVDDVTIKHSKATVTVKSSSPSTIQGNNSNDQKILSNAVLVCVGRNPNTAHLGLKNSNILTDSQGWIKVNSKLKTNNPNIYAIGDILGPSKSMLAHTATQEGKIAATNCLHSKETPMNYKVIPTVVFSQPEIGCVGLSEKQALAESLQFKKQTIHFRTIAMAHVLGEIDGLTKIISEKNSGEILGIQMIGPHCSDLIAEGVLAVKNGITVQKLANTIHAHPTLSEIMMETASECT